MTKRFHVFGIVQGVGFRPTVSRHASASKITGTVCNCGPYVEIMAQGTAEALEAFKILLQSRPPERAFILKIEESEAVDAPVYDTFEIIESAKTKGAIFISPDIAICETCKKEMYDPDDRRYLHPFINCTCCGPRLTILDTLPYDRVRTSMKKFPMCPSCASEYEDPGTRRYDAQPVCCPSCGPEVYLLQRRENGSFAPHAGGIRGHEAIHAVRQVIAEGGIAAVKGIGGFHLCCDASNEEAVMKLRSRKSRPAKPFAVMLKDLDAVLRECVLPPAAKPILTGHQKPILLLEKRTDGRICEAAAPGNPKLGVMLPYAPVQMLLFDYDDDIDMPDALIMTSGNISGAPICHTDEEAAGQLGGLCDVILSNDRDIRIRADDSVMDFYHDSPYMIRRSRGYAPLPQPVDLPGMENSDSEQEISVLAVGGELKNTFCISRGGLLYPSSYIGDLADPRSMAALEETIERYLTLLEAKPCAVVCDPHPAYHSGEIAARIARRAGVPLLYIQHHYAHIAACLAENNRRGKVIGAAYDGTGWGDDGTIWGGEIMLADLSGYTRLASITPFIQVGGDSASREGWRLAAALLMQTETAGGSSVEEAACKAEMLGLCEQKTAKVIHTMAVRNINAVTSTSVGRLFDAVSALLGICRESTFEGEGAMALETSARRYLQTEEGLRGAAKFREWSSIPAGVTGDVPERMPTDRLFQYLTKEKIEGADSPALAWQFHFMLAHMTADMICHLAKVHRVDTAALSGGCFQNGLLLELTEDLLQERQITVLRHGMMPPNDGGIALGQCVAGAAKWLNEQLERKEAGLCV